MRNKSLIASLAVIITLISLYQLYFSLKSRSIDNNIIGPKVAAVISAAKTTNPDLSEAQLDSIQKSATKLVKDSLRDEELGLFGATYADIQRKELNLGLDLQGGIHATVIVSPEDIIKGLAGRNRNNPLLTKTLEATKAAQINNSAKFTDIFYDQFLQAGGEKGGLVRFFLVRENKEKVTSSSTDEEILTMIDKELDEAIDRSVVILRSRIDKFGATQPIIHPVKSTGRIEIELPGIDERERIEQQLSQVAKLEFLDVVDGEEASQIIQTVQAELFKIEEARFKTDEVESSTEDPVQNTDPLLEEDPLVQDDPLLEEVEGDLVESDPLVEGDSNELSAVDSAAQATQDQSVQQLVFNEYFKVQADRGNNGSLIIYNISCNNRYETRMKMYLERPEIKNKLPKNIEIMWGGDHYSRETGELDGFRELHIVKRGRQGAPLLPGDVVVDARPQRSQLDNKIYVNMQMNAQGTKEWARISEDYLSSGQRVAIVMDDVVFSAPGFSSAIPNGSSQISGFNSFTEADDLSNILKAGRLPAPTIIERIVSVGPSLGKLAIDRGLFSLGAGLAIVILFMIAYYNKGGLIANVALLFNIFFILGILSTPSIGAALTLPGIAGIVLTIGMSIDANVLVFERIREEMKLGKPIKAAIDGGYSRAFWTIFDANVTTLIAATILFALGDGLVKGFAVTLMIGIFCSFFSAVYITRLIVEYLTMKKENPNMGFTTGLSRSLFQNLSVKFVEKRKTAYIGSIVVIAAGVIVMFTNGLNLGVAFEGGRSYIVKFDDAIAPSKVKEDLKKVFGDAGVETKTYDNPNQLSITTSYLIEQSGLQADSTVQATLLSGLSNYNDLNPNILQTIVVGPTIAKDIIQTSLTAILLALIAVFVYILVRFRRWQFGLGALFALFHDVLIVLSVFAFAGLLGFNFVIDEVFVAAVLTIVGYSINDTVVVFDRVKEGLQRINSKSSLGDALNTALNGTLSRTLMTSVTTLIVVIILLTFGGEALRGFSFALLVGVLVGTYSSVFVATPIVLDTTKEEDLKEKKEA